MIRIVFFLEQFSFIDGYNLTFRSASGTGSDFSDPSSPYTESGDVWRDTLVSAAAHTALSASPLSTRKPSGDHKPGDVSPGSLHRHITLLANNHSQNGQHNSNTKEEGYQKAQTISKCQQSHLDLPMRIDGDGSSQEDLPPVKESCTNSNNSDSNTQQNEYHCERSSMNNADMISTQGNAAQDTQMSSSSDFAAASNAEKFSNMPLCSPNQLQQNGNDSLTANDQKINSMLNAADAKGAANGQGNSVASNQSLDNCDVTNRENEVVKTPLKRTDAAPNQRKLQGVMMLNPSDLALQSYRF